MSDILTSLADVPYLVWAFTAAGTFYGATAFAVSHLHPDKRAHLSLWLQGDYQSTWATRFCEMFDAVFGAEHWRFRCIALSAVASVVAVLGLWFLFDKTLGLISLRADTGLTLFQALALGAAINIFPDYLSLYETRWLLKRFERVKNPLAQLGVLALDALVTGAIIFLGVTLYLWIADERPVSLIEMVALFSFYAIFFYSTFLTSVWAWAFCLSSWISRLSASLRNWLNVRDDPGRSLALIGGLFVLLGALGLKPGITMDENGRVPIDSFLCDTFPADACAHVARLTKDEEEKLDLLGKACIGGVTEECLDVGLKRYRVDPEQAARLWSKSCEGGDALGCTNLGVLYVRDLGVDRDLVRATDFYEQGCDGGDARGCAYLGMIYGFGPGVYRDYIRSRVLYDKACQGGNSNGCTNLGVFYNDGLGVEENQERARDLHRKGCDAGGAHSCQNLGIMFETGRGGFRDTEQARALYVKACFLNYESACKRLENLAN